jgi:hypothetical protein
MTPAAIVSHVVTTTQAAADYRTIIRDYGDDPITVDLMLKSLAFEAAKRGIGEPRATQLGPVALKGTKVSLCIVINERAVFCVVETVTGRVSIITDERRKAS